MRDALSGYDVPAPTLEDVEPERPWSLSAEARGAFTKDELRHDGWKRQGRDPGGEGGGQFLPGAKEVLNAVDAARDYGDEVDRVSVSDTDIVARSEGMLTIQADAGNGHAEIHASLSPTEADDWATSIDGMVAAAKKAGRKNGDADTIVDHEIDGSMYVGHNRAGDIVIRWLGEDNDPTDVVDRDGIDFTPVEATAFAAGLRDMGYITADRANAPDEDDAEEPDGDETPIPDDERSRRDRTLRLLGIVGEVRFNPKQLRHDKGTEKGGEFKSLADRVSADLAAWIAGGRVTPDPLSGYTQPQLKTAATNLGLAPPKGLKLIPLKSLLMSSAPSLTPPAKAAPAKAVATKKAPRKNAQSPRSFDDFTAGITMLGEDGQMSLRARVALAAGTSPTVVADEIDAWLGGADGPTALEVRVRAGEFVPGHAAFNPDMRAVIGAQLRAQHDRWTEVVRRMRAVTSPKKATTVSAKTRPPATSMPIRDLFAADDATIETVLRDVFEGQFGPYTTKATVGIIRAGTRVDKKGRTHAVDPQVWVEGKVYDANGYEIGHFGRSISPVDMHYLDGRERREMWAEHSVVELTDGEDGTKYQGKGFGGAFNRRAIEWYRASGVHGIRQKDHNGYVWASQGFDFFGGRVPDHTAAALRERIADLRAGRTKNQFGETIPKALREAPDLELQIGAAEELLARLASTQPGDPTYPTAREFSQLGRNGRRGKTATWLGKSISIAADQLILNPDEGEVLSQ